jgi:hypothetical protein
MPLSMSVYALKKARLKISNSGAFLNSGCKMRQMSFFEAQTLVCASVSVGL